MKKIEYYQLVKTEWLPDEEPQAQAQAQAQEIKKPTGGSQWVSSLLIGLVIVECMLAYWLYLH